MAHDYRSTFGVHLDHLWCPMTSNVTADAASVNKPRAINVVLMSLVLSCHFQLYSLSTVRQYSPVMSLEQGVTDRLLKRAADHWRGQMHARTSRFQPFEAGEKLLEELLDFGTGEVGA